MKLSDKVVGKVDSLLLKALEAADEHELLRVIMTLGAESSDSAGERESAQPDPKQFATRQEYRQELIRLKEKQLSAEISQTLNALANLSMTIRGGKMSSMIVAEGSAVQIVQALELPGVRRAILDREFRLIEPRRGEDDAESD